MKYLLLLTILLSPATASADIVELTCNYGGSVKVGTRTYIWCGDRKMYVHNEGSNHFVRAYKSPAGAYVTTLGRFTVVTSGGRVYYSKDFPIFARRGLCYKARKDAVAVDAATGDPVKWVAGKRLSLPIEVTECRRNT